MKTKSSKKVTVVLYVITAIWKNCKDATAPLGYYNQPLFPATERVLVTVRDAKNACTLFNRAFDVIMKTYRSSEEGRQIWFAKGNAMESERCATDYMMGHCVQDHIFC